MSGRKRLGYIGIPEQMIVTGHGDTMLSEVAEPTLTTVHYYYEESGVKAARILMDKIDKKEEEHEGNINKNQMGYLILEKQSSRMGEEK